MKPQVKSSGASVVSTPRKGYKWPLSLKFAAPRLGCSPQHLGRVLEGLCPDHHNLAGKYRALCQKHAKNATNQRPNRARLRVIAAAA